MRYVHSIFLLKDTVVTKTLWPFFLLPCEIKRIATSEKQSAFDVQVKLNKEISVLFQKHFMMELCEGVFCLPIQLLF